MTKIAKREEQQELAHLQPNYFEVYGQQMQTGTIAGRLLKFSKGDWLAGQDNEELPIGTKLAVAMDQFLVGWVKWVDNRPEQQLMGLLVEGHKPPKRSELGDTDQDSWEVGDDGQARDPWQYTNYVLMKEPGKKSSDDNLYTFTTSSRGGLNALGNLCVYYGKEMRARPGDNPIIELGVDSYMHPNKSFGRIKIPVLKPVGWEAKKLFVK